VRYRNDRDYGLTDLDAGTKTMLADFERAIRELVEAEAYHVMDRTDASASRASSAKRDYIRAKRTFVRHLLRKQGTLPPSKQGRKRGHL
jgi:hypothetical protein